MLDFYPRHFSSTFNSSPYYNGDLNGFDIMIMNSQEKADAIIEEIKQDIDDLIERGLMTNNYSFSINDDDILDSDIKRIENEVKRYLQSRNI